MQDPLLRDIRRVRMQRLKELKRDFKRAIEESNARLLKLCDVVTSPTGKQRFFGSEKKMYDERIAPKLRREEARARGSSPRATRHR